MSALYVESPELCVQIVHNEGVLCDLHFEGNAAGDPVLTLYAKYCIGRSLREAAEHSAIYVVQKTFENSHQKKKKGIDCIEMGGPVLVQAQNLLRKALHENKEYLQGWNFEDREFKVEWLQKTEEEKRDILDSIAKEYLINRGYHENALRLIQIDQHERLFYEFSEGVPISSKPSLLLGLEHEFQSVLDERLEVFLVEMKDQHKLRRL